MHLEKIKTIPLFELKKVSYSFIHFQEIYVCEVMILFWRFLEQLQRS